ncbi:MAG: segregation/condensation protein A [Acinetobacter sp.]|nr:segregation/condensation protein A [Acinetobacter sp.]
MSITSRHHEANTPIRVRDEWQTELPEDLYIPPAAFEVLLEHFEGPLDFLIYLIRKNGFDLLQLDIAPIASQYLHYIESMKSMNIELTADYMVMAALLADLKSRLLLPKPQSLTIEDDPKQQLVDRLEHYLRIKQAAERLNQMPVLERDTFNLHVALGQMETPMQGFHIQQLHDALLCVFNRPEAVVHVVETEHISLQDKIQHIEQQLNQHQTLSFYQLLNVKQGKVGLVVTFMAILELTRQQKVMILHDGIEQQLTIQAVAV